MSKERMQRRHPERQTPVVFKVEVEYQVLPSGQSRMRMNVPHDRMVALEILQEAQARVTEDVAQELLSLREKAEPESKIIKPQSGLIVPA